MEKVYVCCMHEKFVCWSSKWIELNPYSEDSKQKCSQPHHMHFTSKSFFFLQFDFSVVFVAHFSIFFCLILPFGNIFSTHSLNKNLWSKYKSNLVNMSIYMVWDFVKMKWGKWQTDKLSPFLFLSLSLQMQNS